MPYPEYHSWELFSLVEPFGWHNTEYAIASVMAMLYNVNRGKGKPKKTQYFMRDMVDLVITELNKKENELRTSELTREELIALIKKDFGI